ncbi:MAG: hypothetical protein DRG30_09615 [Epsilonproteobacteria bacterium]|nr:MAG: hypothetical protein DRG30_09615 [Campylobacterota bacterium]
MTVYERVCCHCGKKYGCKWEDEYKTLHVRNCSDCIFSMFKRACFEDFYVTVDITHGICKECMEKHHGKG